MQGRTNSCQYFVADLGLMSLAWSLDNSQVCWGLKLSDIQIPWTLLRSIRLPAVWSHKPSGRTLPSSFLLTAAWAALSRRGCLRRPNLGCWTSMISVPRWLVWKFQGNSCSIFWRETSGFNRSWKKSRSYLPCHLATWTVFWGSNLRWTKSVG